MSQVRGIDYIAVYMYVSRPAQLNKELLDKLKYKKEAY